jgi:F-type H+-transporting ATPase subunit b
MKPNKNKKIVLFGAYFIFVLIALFLGSTDTLAAENTQNWRSTFDTAMRWLNFGIIAFLLVKFAKTPIKDFLSSRKEEIDRKIKKYERQKVMVEEQIEEAAEMLKDSMNRFEEIKKRIIEDGERKKNQILEAAQLESRILLNGTQQKIKNQILEAGNTIRSEIIESAIALAEKRLPDEITAADEQNLIDSFLKSAESK